MNASSSLSKSRETLFDPTWNHVPRTLLLYALPLGLLALCLDRGLVGVSRDFWVPFLWGLLIPWVNTGLRAGRPWAFKDFQNRDTWFFGIPVVHGAVWALAIHIAPSPAAAGAVFFFFFLAYDALLIRYEILCVYALPEALHRKGTLATLAGFGLFWWAYAALGLTLVHRWGSDTLTSIGICALAMIAPMQIFLLTAGRRWFPDTRLKLKRVAVIGAGWSGLYALKWLRECGLEAVAFESGEDVGGVWRFCGDRAGGVTPNTRATSSKHFLHASDFPFDRSVPDFPSHEQVLEFLESYAERFRLRPHIRFQSRVEQVEKEGPGWRIQWRDKDGVQRRSRFDAVAICSGPHQHRRIETADDFYSRFEGPVMAADECKSPEAVSPDERILVVGVGESAADVAAECAVRGARVWWAARRGQWFADRNIGPYPADHFTALGIRTLLGRFGNLEHLVRRLVIAPFIHLAWGRGGHGISEWYPTAPYLHQFINKSRDAIREIHRGRVTPLPQPTRIDGKKVFFEGRAEPIDFDRVILATGYRPGWPFLNPAPERFYRKVFPVDDPTLAFVGFARPVLGSIPSLAELQARWAACVWSGRATLPHVQRRRVCSLLDERIHERAMLDSSPHDALVDQETYASEVASHFGAQVRWLRLLMLRPRTFWVTARSPWAAFKYRLDDPQPAARRKAVVHLLRELPPFRKPGYGGHQVYLLFWGLLLFTAASAAALAAALLTWPAAQVATAFSLLSAAGGVLGSLGARRPSSRKRR